MKRAYYSDSINEFISKPTNQILGILADNNEFALELTQKDSWKYQIESLKVILSDFSGSIFFEFDIPRMGKRIDVLLLINSIIFVIEYKVGEKEYTLNSIDQVWDYALDLKNFHKTSHDKLIVPIIVATHAENSDTSVNTSVKNDKLLNPIKSNSNTLYDIIWSTLQLFDEGNKINKSEWENGGYHPTPTIIEAALALYNKHGVNDISRNDASAVNLRQTSEEITSIIKNSRDKKEKAICFVTGVPGAGKTLVGLNIATKHFDNKSDLYSVFLSGNGPLVKILQEALARDKVKKAIRNNEKLKIGAARSEVKTFIQNVHHFRDESLKDDNPPVEHVALFDEAQRAWTLEKTKDFMKRRKKKPNFNQSEPEYLISCLDRHTDWAVVVCLVGGGQEINTGEAGIKEWIDSVLRSFPDWRIYISNRLRDKEYDSEEIFAKLNNKPHVLYSKDLHLSVSMRSFRAENVSLLVKHIIDTDVVQAQKVYQELKSKYPIVITRDFKKAKNWLRNKARGSERYGMVVSSQAQRLKPYAIDIKSPIDPIHWFLNDKDDIRSSYYLEDVATEFHVQGLELDWACIAWDGDFRYNNLDWIFKSFRGNKWQNINNENRKLYLKNAYRVLLTRARQGMVICVPEGSTNDITRRPEYYDSTYEYLKSIGFEEI